MPEIEIRLLEERNVAAVLALLNAQMQEHDIATPLDTLEVAIRMYLSMPQYGFLLVAVQNEQVIGVACASALLSLEYGGVSGWLEELYVLPRVRSQGIGSLLVASVLNHAGEIGWKAMDLDVEEEHLRATNLYRRHGFREHTRRRYYRILNGATPFNH
jgi:ribosomal protein S18 acetylase RimI-like enzyme